MDWIHLAPDRDQWRALVNNEPPGSIKCYECLEWLSRYASNFTEENWAINDLLNS
jgi:hypothetical protein